VQPAAQRARQRRARGQRPRAQENELPLRQCLELAREGAEQGPFGLTPLEHDRRLLRSWGEALEVHAGRYDPVAAGKPLGGGGGRLAARGEECVEPAQQALAPSAGRRVRESLGGEERRDRERRGVPQRDVGEARQPGLEAVDDVERARREREGQVRAYADRHSDPAAARDRDGGSQGHQFLVADARSQRPAARGQVARAVRGREDGHRVTARPQLPCETGDVLVDVVRLRPGEGRDEGDSECHRSLRV
jgi:hypothetical protein